MAALRRSLTEVVRRHESLRTVFAAAGGEPVQVIRGPAPAALPVVELSGLSAEARGRETLRLAAEEAARPFDLAAGPLLRATVVRAGGAEHALLLTLHHVVSDGWSMDVLVREVSALYAGEPLPELPVQYADYALWQREWLSGDVLEAQLGWWRDRLAGAPPVLELPADRPRSLARDGRVSRVPFSLPAETSRALRELSRREGATPFMTLLAAWQALLARYAGTEDVSVGTPIAGRTRLETEPLIGFFVNTLVLRADLSGEPDFRALLGRVREATLGAYAHQEVPFERLVEELAPERSLAHSPLFQVLFVLQDAGGEAPRPGGLRVEPIAAGGGSAKFDLTLALADGEEAIRGTLAYRTALFDAATAERMLEHFGRVLEAAASAPETPVSRVPLLSAGERRRLLVEWNDTARGHPRDATVHGLFAAQAARTPDAAALSFAGGTLTYAELHARSGRLAHALRGRGVGPESRVGICVERSPGMLVAMLAVLQAGGAYVPLDPAHPLERLRYVLEDAGVRVLLVGSAGADPVPGFEGERVGVDEADADAPGEAPESGVLPENLAYVIYTSGSTGRPKGVQVEHRSVVALLHWLRGHVRPEERESVLASTSITFDVSVAEIFDTLCGGGKLVLVGNALELAGVPESEGVRLAYMVPGAAAELLRMGALPPGLRALNLAGEALPADLAAALRAAGVERVANVYGPTEVTVYATCGEVEAGAARVTIGRPIDDARAYVLDPALEPAPVGVAGELCLGGAGVARGYLGRAELTAERFVPDPFGGEPGARMYRTGDRVRWLASGELEYLGRIDFQVKVRGFRIEPGEVEAALREREEVAEAVVVALEEGEGSRRLVGYVVAARGRAADAAELRRHLRDRLPGYMVPGALVVLDALPLTASGKLDRRALPAPDASGAEGDHAAPRTPGEEVLAGIFAAVLKRERVGVHDGFFDLGGHSLLATRVVSHVRAAFRVELPLRAVFEAPTVAALAERVGALLREGAAEAPPLVPVPRDGSPLPLSFAQQRLWMVDQMEPGNTAYNMPAALRLRGPLDAGALERALAELVRRHETLRTVFAVAGGEPVQVVGEPGPVRVPVADLRALPAEAREAEAARLAAEEARRPFDLAARPPLRCRVLRLGAEEWALLFTLHHAAGDGWSMGVLVREASELYAARLEGRAPVLPDLPVQYADFAVWQRAWLSGDALEAQLAYWRARLAGAPPLLELPTDRPRPPVQGPRAGRVPFHLDAAAARGLRALARSEGATPYMVLLAGWSLLLSRWSGQEDVSVGVPVAGRTRAETEGLIGLFVNALVLRAELSGSPTVRELVGRVREATLGAYAHQELPFERLVEELQPDRTLRHSPLFQVQLVLQNQEREVLRFSGVELEPLGGAADTVKLDLSLNLTESEDGVRGALAYRAELFDDATAARMLRHLRVLLDGFAADPERSASAVELMDAAEREEVLARWNDTAAEIPALRLHEGFAGAGVARAGGRRAGLRRGDAHLRRAGPPGQPPGAPPRAPAGHGPRCGWGSRWSAPRRWWSASSPSSRPAASTSRWTPTHPAERLAYQVEDSGAALLVTTAPLLERLAPVAAEPVLLDRDADAVAAQSDAPLAGGAGPENLAYVIYTSGSTGRPKGVMTSHRAAAHSLAWLAGETGLGPDDVVLQRTTISFDASIRDLLGPLSAGARVVLPPADELADPFRLLERMRAERVTAVLAIVPSVLRLLLAAAEASGEPAPLRLLLASGEPLAADDARRARAAFGGVRVGNLWGATECTMAQTLHTVSGEEAGIAPLGFPMANTRVYVLDGELEPVPVGVPGEACIAAEGVARGYGGRPDLTAEKMVPDPFGAPGARLYRTGDRVRRRGDGNLEFLGRMDHQVKVRGVRVEPGEVEAALRGLPGVRAAVVAVQETAPGENRLVAYVVGEEAAVAPGALRGRLDRSLPSHMVPSVFVRLEAIPLLPNGKADLAALPSPEGHLAGEGEHVAPRTATEEIVAGLWSEVLGVERVGVRDDFFDLGGHSLLATRLVTRIRTTFGADLPLRALFEDPTVAGLAARLDAGRTGGAPAPAEPEPIPRVAEPGKPLPLSFAQQRLWLVNQLDTGSRVYNQAVALRMHGRLDVAALRRAFTEIVRRHAVLRTRFVEHGGRPRAGHRPPVPGAAPDGGRRRGPRLGGDAGGAGARGDAPPLRPGFRRAAARAPGAALPHRARPGGGDAPHRPRRVEHGGAGAGADHPLRRLLRGARVAAPGAPHPVRRLRRLAARLAHPGARAGAARLLEARAGRAPGAAPGRRPGARLGGHRRGQRGVRPLPRDLGRGARPGPEAGRHPLHDAARGLQDRAALAGEGGRGGGGHRRRQPQRAHGDRGTDRLLREPAGAPHRPGGGAHLRRAGGPRPRREPRRLRPPGPPLRPGGGGAQSQAVGARHAVLPGQVRGAERPRGGHAAPRPGPGAGADRPRRGADGPAPGHPRAPGPPDRRLRVPHLPVQPGAHRPLGALVRAGAGGGRGGPRDPARRPGGAARRGRARRAAPRPGGAEGQAPHALPQAVASRRDTHSTR